jgi:hypothetical protein
MVNDGRYRGMSDENPGVDGTSGETASGWVRVRSVGYVAISMQQPLIMKISGYLSRQGLRHARSKSPMVHSCLLCGRG